MGRPISTTQPAQMTSDLLEEGLMTIPDTCAYLSVSTSLVWRLMSDGELPYTKIGGARRIPRVAVKRLVIQGLKL